MVSTTSTPIQSGTPRPTVPHLHAAAEACPLCDQPIPQDRFDEIKARIETRRRQERLELEADFEERLGQERADAVAQALDHERQHSQAREAAAREEGRITGEAEAREALKALDTRVAEAETARATAEQSEEALKLQLDEARTAGRAEVDRLKQEAESNARAVREQAHKEALASVQERISVMEHERQTTEEGLLARIEGAEAAKTAAEESNTALQSQLQEIQRTGEQRVQTLQKEADERVTAARTEATAVAEAAMQAKMSAAEQARADAEGKAAAAAEQMRALELGQQAEVARQLQEQRDILERDKSDALNAERSAAFEKELRLSNKVDELQRALANKTAEELGEGAEIDLFETLKGQFAGDKIKRINKGQPGADILQTVIHNGQDCGSIIYDSKNHAAWRNEFATKLAQDQMAAKADHAILSTRKFPRSTRQLHVQDGVILAAPARVATIAQIVRQYIIATHAMHLSNKERARKTSELYALINSGRFRDLLKRIDAHAERLLDLQVKDKKAHDAMWKTQGEVIRSIQKTQSEVTREIDVIIGTSEELLEEVSHE